MYVVCMFLCRYVVCMYVTTVLVFVCMYNKWKIGVVILNRWCAFLRKEHQDPFVLGHEKLWLFCRLFTQSDKQHPRTLYGTMP